MKLKHAFALAAVLGLSIANVAFSAEGRGVDGFFGLKFGERIASDKPTIPSPDGTLICQIEPKDPEFHFETYCAFLLPKTRSVCGFVATSDFSADEKAKCQKVYQLHCQKISARFGKMKDASDSPSPTGSDLDKVCRAGMFVVPGRMFLFVYEIKLASGGYQVRLLAADINRMRLVVEESKALASATQPLTGLLGKKLGEVCRKDEDEAAVANGAVVQVFEPEKRFLDFKTYAIQCLPKSRKVFAITAICDFEDRLDAVKCYADVSRLLEKKFGLKFADATTNFTTDRPDEDGEQMLKAAVMAFPNSMRYLEIHCLKDVDDDVFRVRFTAEDAQLMQSLDSERKALKQDRAERDALDAL